MKRFKTLIVLLLTMAMLLMPFSASGAGLLPEAGKSLTGYTVILHTNDTHGRAVPNSSSGLMGFTAVSALKKSYEAAGAQVILLDAGDTLHGLPFATLVQGESIVEIMNLVGYDAFTPGNHDFNYGLGRLLSLTSLMDFPLLSANITVEGSNKIFFNDNMIIEKNGVKYGIFGLSTPETSFKTNPNNVRGISFRDPIEAAKQEVIELKELGATFIIALAHLGTDLSSEVTSKLVAEKVEGIDLIVDGHSHSIFEEGLAVGDTLIVSTGDYINNIGVVMIDKEGKVTADLVNATEFKGTDEAVDKLTASFTSAQDAILDTVVGTTEVELDGIREHVRAGETNLGNLTTDAMRYVTGADVAFTNGGGIRASIPVGDITKRDIITVFPFGNYVVTKKITGEALLQALEHGTSGYPAPTGSFTQVSGVTFNVDVTKPAGSRVGNVKVNGVALDKSAEYVIATNDFMVAGGDGYTMLKDFPIANEFDALENVIEEYIKYLGEVTTKVENRITYDVVEEIETETPAKEEGSDSEAVAEDGDTEKERLDYVVYVVKSGDYLRKIADALLDKESDWKKIYEWNKDVIKNPDKIYIGQKIKIYAE
jgi:5'-nucleotidase / UDP-sugar diphosphatase